MTIPLFALAAALGALIRWKISSQWGQVGTWVLNMAGAFGLGLLTGVGGIIGTIVGTAGIGALTTVSGVAHELSILARVSRFRASAYLLATLVAGVCFAWLGVRWG